MKTENQDKLAAIVDYIENIQGSLMLPMPPQFHVDQMKGILPDGRKP